MRIVSGSALDVLVPYGPKDRRCVGHGREYDVYQQFDMHWGEGRESCACIANCCEAS